MFKVQLCAGEAEDTPYTVLTVRFLEQCMHRGLKRGVGSDWHPVDLAGLEAALDWSEGDLRRDHFLFPRYGMETLAGWCGVKRRDWREI